MKFNNITYDKQNTSFVFCMSLVSYPVNFILISEPLYLQNNLGKEESLSLEDQHTPCLHCMGHLSMNETLYPVDGGLVGYQDATSLYQTNKNIVLLSCTVHIKHSKTCWILFCSTHAQTLDEKYCIVHSSCTYDPNNNSEVDTTCTHHTVTEQYTFSVLLFPIFFSASFFLHLFFHLFFFLLCISHILSLIGLNSLPKL
jgi:hypothetical protein